MKTEPGHPVLFVLIEIVLALWLIVLAFWFEGSLLHDPEGKFWLAANLIPLLLIQEWAFYRVLRGHDGSRRFTTQSGPIV